MKTSALIVVGLVVFSFANLRSEVPNAAAKTPVQALQALKAQNQQLLERQAQMLLKLEELEKDAQQLKFFSKRT